MTIRFTLAGAMLGFCVPAALTAQAQLRHPTIVYAMGQEATLPLPVIGAETEANTAVADQLFLHLAVLAPSLQTVGDNALVPSLARSWRRVDPRTIVFEIDPRARWHDGVPVTAHDVVFTWQLMHSPVSKFDASRTANVTAVEAVDAKHVRVRYKHPSGEQVYVFAFLMQPLPAHLLESMDPAQIAGSDFATHPVGDGPFRWTRRVPGQLTELQSDPGFFLGRPTISRLIFRYVEDPAARLTLFLTGETDILDNIPATAMPQVRQRADARIIGVPSGDLLYFLYNTRDPTDTTRAHPMLSDARVREALALALDRGTIARTAYGPGTAVPDAAQSQAWRWIQPDTATHPPQNMARARRLLAQAGWRDANGDGILDHNGTPLRFTVIYPASSAVRHDMAIQAQQMWRAVGADAQLDRVEVSVYVARRQSGRWDLELLKVGQDPTPSSLVQSWSCQSAARQPTSNVAHWCDPVFDSLLASATLAGGSNEATARWRAVLHRMAVARPAIFLAAPVATIAVSRRYDNVVIWPSHPWLSVWQWRVRPQAALPRDR